MSYSPSVLSGTFVGNALNALTRGRVLPFPEQRDDFVAPLRLVSTDPEATAVNSPESTPRRSSNAAPASPSEKRSPRQDVESAQQALADAEKRHAETPGHAVTEKHRHHDDLLAARAALAAAEKRHAQHQDSPTKEYFEEDADPNLVGWYKDDPEDPKNWSFGRKVQVTSAICILTFGVYMGSAIYTSSIPGVIEEFGVSSRRGSAGLSIYILAYGMGPMILSPLSDVPSIGRNGVYIPTLFLFVVLCIPTALAPNWSTLMALRFLTGFLGSPALATGGATLADVWPELQLPYAMSIWSIGAVAGPIAGPVVGNFAAQGVNWRMPLWILLMASGIALVVIAFFLPETLPDRILLDRAKRLRKCTGNEKLRSQSEIDLAKLSKSALLQEALWRPFVISMEPSVLFANIYLGLAYGVFYLWFESFPLTFGSPDVFGDIFRTFGSQALPYLGIAVGAALTLPAYLAYLKYVVEPRYHRNGGSLEPEERLEPGLVASVFIPTSLLIFGWCARKEVHWIGSVIGATLYLPGLFLLFQSVLTYLPAAYPAHAASVLAANDLFRSTIAAIFPLIGTRYFTVLHIGPGCSILAGISIVMIPFLALLRYKGATLRKRSKHTDL